MAGGSKWDNPALYANDDAFWDRHYWDNRYQHEKTTFEWYRGFESLEPVLQEHVPKDLPVLQIGVGTSRLQVDMADAGWRSVHSTDYSPVAIERLQRGLYGPRYEGRLTYEVADARDLRGHAAGSFGAVLDKGTLDALLCGDAAEADAAALLREAWRVLAAGRPYVMVTSAPPRSRLPVLEAPGVPWSPLLVYEVGQQGAMDGPHRHERGAAASGELWELPRMGYSHLVYVCYKPPAGSGGSGGGSGNTDEA